MVFKSCNMMVYRFLTFIGLLIISGFLFEKVFAIESVFEVFNSPLCGDNVYCNNFHTIILQNVWIIPLAIISFLLIYFSFKVISNKIGPKCQFEKNLDQFLVVGFIDISDYSSEYHDSDFKTIEKLFDNFSNRVKIILKKHGGKITKFQGDGILFYFEGSDKSEYDFIDVVNFSLSIIPFLKKSEDLKGIQFRLSLSYGPAKKYFDVDGNIDVFGPAVNLTVKTINKLSRKQSQISFNSNLYRVLDDNINDNDNIFLEIVKKRTFYRDKKYKHDFYIVNFNDVLKKLGKL